MKIAHRCMLQSNGCKMRMQLTGKVQKNSKPHRKTRYLYVAFQERVHFTTHSFDLSQIDCSLCFPVDCSLSLQASVIEFEGNEAKKAEKQHVYGTEIKRKIAEGKVEVRITWRCCLEHFSVNVSPQVEFALVNDPGGEDAECDDLGVATVDLCTVRYGRPYLVACLVQLVPTRR